MLKGTGVSAGIGIGRALLIEEHSLEYTPVTITEPQAEKERFNEAVKSFCENTRRQAEALRASVGEKEAGIMLGHISIIEDPFLTGEVGKLIDGGQCAEAALEQICDMFISIFSAAGDDLTRQRAADVRDVRTGVLRALLGISEVNISDVPKDSIIVVRELTPSMAAGINKENVAGIIAGTGSTTSHSAILARVLEIPAVMSVDDAFMSIRGGDTVICDGTAGTVIVSPVEEELKEYIDKRDCFVKEKAELENYRGKPTVSADGTRYELVCNIGKPDDAAKAVENDGEGVGLFRTEYLFMDKTSVPTEEEQFDAYKKAALILKDKPLIIRTLDIGGDKEIPYLGLEKEDNPFMGFRAIRYCLKYTALFRSQLRAIIRASAFGNVSIMFPLITCVEELRAGKMLVEEIKDELREQKTAFDENIKVGIMIETAAAAVIADILAKESDFFSIGTNDLTGYTMACDRGNGSVAYLYSVLQPSVLRMIKRTIECAAAEGIPVGMCGEAAADPLMTPLLISFGLNEFSVAAPSVLRLRKNISAWTKEKADAAAAKAMSLNTQAEIRAYLSSVI